MRAMLFAVRCGQRRTEESIITPLFMSFLRHSADSVSASTASQKLLHTLAYTHIHAHMNSSFSSSCHTRDGHANKTPSLPLSLSLRHTPSIRFINELRLSNTGVHITAAWHDPSADIITMWWGVVMTHEQRTFGATPKYVTVTITHLTWRCDDFAAVTKDRNAKRMLSVFQ